MPDNAETEEIMYRLYLLDKVRKGQEAAERGETVTSEELKQEIDSWCGSVDGSGHSRVPSLLRPDYLRDQKR